MAKVNLYHGTSFANAVSILGSALGPGWGTTVHRTKTRGYLYLSDELEGAWYYASAFAGGETGVIFEISVDRQKLLPDYDDAWLDVVLIHVEELNKDLHAGSWRSRERPVLPDSFQIELDVPIPDEFQDIVERGVDDFRSSSEGEVFIDYDIERNVVTADPLVRMTAAVTEPDDETLDDMNLQWDEMMPYRLFRQWRIKDWVLPRDIIACYATKSTLWKLGIGRWANKKSIDFTDYSRTVPDPEDAEQTTYPVVSLYRVDFPGRARPARRASQGQPPKTEPSFLYQLRLRLSKAVWRTRSRYRT